MDARLRTSGGSRRTCASATSATVTSPGDQRFPGRITNLGQQFDPETRMLEVRIALDNPASSFVRRCSRPPKSLAAPAQSTLTIPSDAVQEIDNANVVFVLTSPGHFAIRPVRLGETSAGRTPVLEGLQPGEQIVVRGKLSSRVPTPEIRHRGRITTC